MEVYVRKMDRWMDASIYVHNVLCIMDICVWRYVGIYEALCTVFMYIAIYVCVYICEILVYNVHVVMYVLTFTCVCVYVCVFVCILSPFPKLDTDQFGVMLTL